MNVIRLNLGILYISHNFFYRKGFFRWFETGSGYKWYWNGKWHVSKLERWVG